MQNRPDRSEDGKTKSSILFQDFQNLQRIWTHPRVLRYNSDRYEIMAKKKRDAMTDDEEEETGSIKDFIDDEDDDEIVSVPSSTTEESNSESDLSVQSVDSSKPRSSKRNSVQNARRTRANTNIGNISSLIFEISTLIFFTVFVCYI